MMSLNSNSLPSIRDYADCDKLFKRKLAELPRHLRARAQWSETKLPLDAWHKEHLRIELKDDDGVLYYALIYHNTTVLGYYPDGRVFFNASWDTRSTHVFFDELSPYGWYITRARGARFYVNGSKWHAIPMSGYFWLGTDGQPTNPQDFHYKTEVSDRERRKELREIMKPFYTWYHALTRATGSMRAVICDDDALRQMGQSASDKRVIDMARALGEGSLVEEDSWRALVSNAFVSCVPLWARQQERAYNVDEWAETVLDKIEGHVWRHCGGFKDEHRVVKAGEKP